MTYNTCVPVAAILVTCMILVTVVEIFGILGFLGVKFSALPAVSLIMSVRDARFDE